MWSVLFVAVAGCDPGIAVGGFVKEKDGTPIQGAEVRVLCGGKPSRYDRAVSDQGGWFQIYGVGCMPAGCSIEVAPEGKPPQRIEFADHCLEKSVFCNRGCNQAEFRVIVD